MFGTELVLKLVSEDEGLWEVQKPLVFYSRAHKISFSVPAGFRTDLASVLRAPLVYLAFGGTANAPAVLHDWLYQTGRVSRDVADSIFLEAMEEENVVWWRRMAMYWAVRLGGAQYYRG